MKKTIIALGGKKLLAIGAVVGLSFALVSLAGAAEILNANPQNPNVLVGEKDSHKNLYTAGGSVTINGRIAGDLTAAGGMVSVVGDVENEALLAGGSIEVLGSIGGTARVAGGNITMSGPVGGDLVVAGGNLNITGKASVGGDLLIAGGNVILDAPVKGDVRVAGGNVTINSKIDGKVYARATKQLTFGPSAEVSAADFRGPTPAVVEQGAKVGQVNYTAVAAKNFGRSFGVILTLAFLIKFLAWIVAGFVIIYLRKNFVLSVAQEFTDKAWPNLGVGLLTFIVTPIVIMLLFITFIGYYLAFLLAISYALALVALSLVSALVVGYRLLGSMNKPGEAVADWQAILIGVVVWMVLALIPVLGWLVMALVFLMVMGAAVRKIKAEFKH